MNILLNTRVKVNDTSVLGREPVSKPKRQFSALDKSRRRAKQNLETGKVLGEIARKRGDISAEVTADLLKVSADKRANGELINFVDRNGRKFNCPQSLFSANTRLDTNYAIKSARRHRKRIYEAFESHLEKIIENDWSVSLLTPTYPNLLGIGFELNDDFQAGALERFLQMKIFDEFFYAGFIKTESTLGNSRERAKTGRDFDLFIDGLNYHNHAIVVNHKPFADGETSELENRLAFMQKNPGKVDAGEMQKVKDSLRLVDAWTDCLNKSHLEIFGKPLQVNTKSGRVRFKFQNVSLDEIKEYEPNESRNGIFWEVAKTIDYTAKGSSFKDLPPDLLLEAETTLRGKRIINSFGAFRNQVKRKLETKPSLVKPVNITEQELTGSEPKSLFDNALRGENEKLKTYGIRLCEQGLRATWLRYLDANKGVMIENRRKALLERFPNAVFIDLDGETHTGWQVDKMLDQLEKESQPNYKVETDYWHKFKRYEITFDEQSYRQSENQYFDALENRRYEDFTQRLSGLGGALGLELG